jgi:hypothetical protein
MSGLCRKLLRRARDFNIDRVQDDINERLVVTWLNREGGGVARQSSSVVSSLSSLGLFATCEVSYHKETADKMLSDPSVIARSAFNSRGEVDENLLPFLRIQASRCLPKALSTNHRLLHETADYVWTVKLVSTLRAKQTTGIGAVDVSSFRLGLQSLPPLKTLVYFGWVPCLVLLVKTFATTAALGTLKKLGTSSGVKFVSLAAYYLL